MTTLSRFGEPLEEERVGSHSLGPTSFPADLSFDGRNVPTRRALVGEK